MNQITAPPVAADPPLAGSWIDSSAPRIRPLAFPIELGRLWTAGLDEDGRPTTEELDMAWLRVTPLGHWYGSGDEQVKAFDSEFRICRGCESGCCFGEDGAYDDAPCTHPATAQDIATALLASVPRPAPATPRRYYLHTWREGLVTS